MESLSSEQRAQVMRELGRLGGIATANKGPEYLSRRGRKAVQTRWENYRKRKAEEAKKEDKK